MRRSITWGTVVLGAPLLLLPWPDPAVPAPPPGGAPFAWNQDSLWHALEAEFAATRAVGCEASGHAAVSGLAGMGVRLVQNDFALSRCQ